MSIESNVQSDVIFYRIVVPHDLTVRADKALELAGTMAHPLRSEVVLIHVIDPNDRREKERDHSLSKAGDVAKDRWRFLQQAARRLLPVDVKREVHIHSGDPQDVILTEARKLGADLLIITTHPLTGPGYPFSGGKIEHIEREAPCPVLSCQLTGEEEAAVAWWETRKFETHNLKQYCEISRLLSKKNSSHRPVYLGYSRLPASPSGVCD